MDFTLSHSTMRHNIGIFVEGASENRMVPTALPRKDKRYSLAHPVTSGRVISSSMRDAETVAIEAESHLKNSRNS